MPELTPLVPCFPFSLGSDIIHPEPCFLSRLHSHHPSEIEVPLFSVLTTTLLPSLISELVSLDLLVTVHPLPCTEVRLIAFKVQLEHMDPLFEALDGFPTQAHLMTIWSKNKIWGQVPVLWV